MGTLQSGAHGPDHCHKTVEAHISPLAECNPSISAKQMAWDQLSEVFEWIKSVIDLRFLSVSCLAKSSWLSDTL